MLSILKSNSLKINIISNYIGNGGVALLGMLLLPIYLKFLGSEAYGLVGIFTSLQTILLLLDSGLSYTLNKEISQTIAVPNLQSQTRSILRTFEIVYWALSFLALVLAFSISPFIASHWLGASKFNDHYITQCFFLLSLTLFFQFPQSLYTGGLLGSQRHLALNFIKLIVALIKGIGAIVVLKYVGNNLHNFFLWNLVITIVGTFALRVTLNFYIRSYSGPAKFDFQLIRKRIKFAAGMSGIALSSVLLSQLDKVILSKILSLENFGYYTIGTTIGMVLYQFGTPLTQSYFPRLSELFAKKDIIKLNTTYNQGSKLLALMVFPASFVLIFFGKYLLNIFLHNPEAIDAVLPICEIYSMGVALNVMVNMPFILSLAYNNSRIFFWGNIGLSVLFLFSVLIGVHYWNALGAVLAWAFINLIYILVMPVIVHSRLSEVKNYFWYLNSFIKPLLISGITLFVFHSVFQLENISWGFQLIFISLFGLVAVFLNSPVKIMNRCMDLIKSNIK